MEFKNQNGAATHNGSVKETTSKTSQNGEAKKENGIPAKKEATISKVDADKAKADQTPAEMQGVAKQEPTQPAAPKVEVPPVTADKPAVTLEATLKAVDSLHRKSIQRINLLSRMKQLDTFEVNLAQENDELGDNPYQGCKLIIEDDKHRQFVTTVPGLIRLTSQFIFNSCNQKLIEIEASIVFPKM